MKTIKALVLAMATFQALGLGPIGMPAPVGVARSIVALGAATTNGIAAKYLAPPDARVYALEGGIPNLYVDRVVISLDEPIGEGLELRDSFERKNGAERLASFGIQYLYTDGTRKALVDHAPWVSRTRVIYRGDGDEAIYAIDTDP